MCFIPQPVALDYFSVSMFLFRTAPKQNKNMVRLAWPDVDNSMALDEHPKIQDVVASINGQKIEFSFRKVDPNSRGMKTLKSVAEGMSFLPGYHILLEGYSNLVVREEKLTDEDKARIQKLCEGRADACACLLRDAGVQNDITCIGQGALKDAKTGCVRITLFPNATPSQNQEFSKVEQPKLEAALVGFEQPEFETDLPSLLRPCTGGVPVISKDGLPFIQRAEQEQHDLKLSCAPFTTPTPKADAVLVSSLPPPPFERLDL